MKIFGFGSTQADAALGVCGDVVVPDDSDALFVFRFVRHFDHTSKMVGNPTSVNSNLYLEPVRKVLDLAGGDFSHPTIFHLSTEKRTFS